jgi:4-aminobutyrate aminotransferase-like enzyme
MSRFEEGLRSMLEAIAAEQHDNDPPLSGQQMAHELRGLTAIRGVAPRYPYLGSGRGRGSRVMMADGRWMLDFGSPGNLFGHGNLELIEVALRAAATDLVTQNRVAINREPYLLSKAILDQAPAGMTQCALAPSADTVARMAFEFAVARRGRRRLVSLGSPIARRLNADAFELPLIDPDDRASADACLASLRGHLRNHARETAALVVEPIGCASGFRIIPAEFLTPLFDACRAEGVAVWLNESLTFGRTPRIFATLDAGLGDYTDILTVGGAIEPFALLWRSYGAKDPAPAPLDSLGATVAMAVARRMLEKLIGEGYLGDNGKIARFSALARGHLMQIAERHPGALSAIDGLGCLLSFQLYDGHPVTAKEFADRCFRAGLLLDTAVDRMPARIVCLLPAGDLTEAELAEGGAIIEASLS